MRVPRRIAPVKPVVRNSPRITVGTIWPSNGSKRWNSAGGTDARASPAGVVHRSTFTTWPSPTGTRYPTTPCWHGGRPVVSDVSAVDVVVGATDVMGPPVIDASV